jgi:hypothetical protein
MPSLKIIVYQDCYVPRRQFGLASVFAFFVAPVFSLDFLVEEVDSPLHDSTAKIPVCVLGQAAARRLDIVGFVAIQTTVSNVGTPLPHLLWQRHALPPSGINPVISLLSKLCRVDPCVTLYLGGSFTTLLLYLATRTNHSVR